MASGKKLASPHCVSSVSTSHNASMLKTQKIAVSSGFVKAISEDVVWVGFCNSWTALLKQNIKAVVKVNTIPENC